MVRYKVAEDVFQLEPHAYLLSKQAFNAMVKTKVMPDTLVTVCIDMKMSDMSC